MDENKAKPKRKRRKPKKPAVKLPKATKVHYDMLVRACVDAIIDGEREASIVVIYDNSVAFPKKMPWGISPKGEKDKRIRVIRARILLQWLFENGYTTVNSNIIWHTHVWMSRKFNALANIDVDVGQDIMDNVLIDELNEEGLNE